MNKSGYNDPTADVAIARVYKEWKRGRLMDKERENKYSYSAKAKQYNRSGIVNAGKIGGTLPEEYGRRRKKEDGGHEKGMP